MISMTIVHENEKLCYAMKSLNHSKIDILMLIKSSIQISKVLNSGYLNDNTINEN